MRGRCGATPLRAAAGTSGRRSASAARALLAEHAPRPPSARLFWVGHARYVRNQFLSEHLLEVSDDVGDVRLDGLPVGLFWAERSFGMVPSLVVALDRVLLGLA